ncbi:hypothetical protein CJD36_017710 [Flavipsychrobacter stenotrophus]|uniref:Response regulatory domain-containing protein n=1 Tax=Flavipsychrobacter stenotrophus TaxID=2077091 RepID=A0A2S7SSP9_9BACT|nr:response regulator transcription factor [Flavipsychrobacter stenotrophus]PQJ09764.1 hypothetical protein CJD36_017710 [Flavipsychrobacter stenotrophus]
MTKSTKILSYITERNEPTTTVEIFEELFNGSISAIEERGIRRKYITSISVKMHQLCNEGVLRSYSAKKRGLYYCLPEWFSGDKLKAQYQYKLENKLSARISIALIDDQILFRKALKGLIHSFGNTDVIMEADNGSLLLDQINNNSEIPHICIISSQAIMLNNNETLKAIKKQYPGIKVLMLISYNEVFTFRKMVFDGANSVLTKNCQPEELQKAIYSLRKKKYYYESAPIDHREVFNRSNSPHSITNRQQTFLSLNLAGLSGVEIATKLGLSERTVDGYREILYKNFNVDNRLRLLVFVIKNGLVDLNNVTAGSKSTSR